MIVTRRPRLLLTFAVTSLIAFTLLANLINPDSQAQAQASTLTINLPWGICGNTAAQGNQGFDCVNPPSSLRFDPVTANKVCSVHGYRTVIRMSDNQDGRTGYSSPGNNGIIHWNGSSWVKQNARAAGNHWLASITCGDPIASSPTPTPTPGPGQCQDNLDNDSDGFIDRRDPDCYDASGVFQPNNSEDTTNTSNQCVDGSDNDNDGTIDRNDNGCHSDNDATDGDNTFVPTEDELPRGGTGGAGQCQDNLDNDSDGFIDRRDPDCYDANGTFNPANNEDTTNSQNQCVDQIDNDSDSTIDFNDHGCHTDGDATDGDNSFDPSEDELPQAGSSPTPTPTPSPGQTATRLTCLNPGLVGPSDPLRARLNVVSTGNAIQNALITFDTQVNPVFDTTDQTDNTGQAETRYAIPADAGISGTDTFTARFAGTSNLAPASCSRSFNFRSDGFEIQNQCNDGVDNESDGFADRRDPDCYNSNGTFQPDNLEDTVDSQNQCVDGTDNDNDGTLDRNDNGCHSDNDATDGDNTFVPTEDELPRGGTGGVGQCQDAIDNDGDGFIDRDDPDCYDSNGSFDPNNSEDTNNQDNQCVDNQDNDNDGDIDENDADCHTDGDPDDGDDTFDPTRDEDNNDDDDDAGQCSDNSDNDGDGFEDEADPDCYGDDGNFDPDNDEDTSNDHNQCIDKRDNEGDRLIDFSDPDCHTDNDPLDGDNSFAPGNRENQRQGRIAGDRIINEIVQLPTQPVTIVRSAPRRLSGKGGVSNVPITAPTGVSSFAALSTLTGAVGLAARKFFL